MTIKEASKILKCDVLTVRLLLQQGQPWGSAVKLGNSKHYYYTIFDAEFKRLFGGGSDAE